MKRFYTFISALILSVSLCAQAPQIFSYQAVVRGANNTLVTNKTVGMKISLLQGSENGTVVYVETHSPTANENGLVSISIGSGKLEKGIFSTIDWSKGPYFLKTETDPVGGTNYSLIGISQLLSVPYALNAGNGYSRVSKNGDTVYFENNKFVIIPGISMANLKTSGYGEDLFDIDNNQYKTVYIGTQQWMAENLKTSKYNDGTPISNVKENLDWKNSLKGGFVNFYNDIVYNEVYGKLYNWYVVDPINNGNKNVCPAGWHIPSKDEWGVLINYLGGDLVAAGKMKKVGERYWNNPNKGATNSSQFSAISGGIRSVYGDFVYLGDNGYWWSSTNENQTTAWCLFINYNSESTDRYAIEKNNGFSIRCLKD